MKAKERKIDLLCETDVQLIDKEFTTDRRRLKQILLNLVNNAFKSTTEGYVKIKTTFKRIRNKSSI